MIGLVGLRGNIFIFRHKYLILNIIFIHMLPHVRIIFRSQHIVIHSILSSGIPKSCAVWRTSDQLNPIRGLILTLLLYRTTLRIACHTATGSSHKPEKSARHMHMVLGCGLQLLYRGCYALIRRSHLSPTTAGRSVPDRRVIPVLTPLPKAYKVT